MPDLRLSGKNLLAGITLTSGMGFILFGYDNGVMGGLLTAPSFEDQFKLSSSMQGTVTAIYEIGCMFGSVGTAIWGGSYGRRTLAHWGTLILTVGAILQCSSYSVAQLVVGRIVAGVGMGLISSNVAIWQAETAPANARGTLIACSLSFLILGQLIAYWTDYGMSFYEGSVSWRFPMALQIIFALLLSAMLFVMPESPRYLMMKDRIQQATDVLQRLKDDAAPEVIAAEVVEIKEAMILETNSQKGWTDLLRGDKVKSRRRVAIACAINLMQDFSGSTPISYYTTYIFENSVGFSRHMSLLMSGFLQVWFLIASTGTWYLIERAGRRRMFLVSAFLMGIVMVIFAAMLAIDTRTGGIVATVMIFAYQTFYTWGFMGGVWTYGPEVLPLEYRSKGTGLATAVLWLFSFVVVEIVPSSISNIGWKTYIIFAIFNFSFIPIIYWFFPETKGFTLEMVDLAFMDSQSPVKRAKELQRIKNAGEQLTLREDLGEKEVDAEHIE